LLKLEAAPGFNPKAASGEVMLCCAGAARTANGAESKAISFFINSFKSRTPYRVDFLSVDRRWIQFFADAQARA